MESIFLFHSALAGDSVNIEKRGQMNEGELLAAAGQAAAYARERGFDYAPIDRAGIEALAKSHSKGSLEETSRGLEAAKGLEEKLSSLVTEKPVPASAEENPAKVEDRAKGFASLARSCFWNSLLAQKALGRERTVKPAARPAAAEVRFAVSQEGWVSVRKAGANSAREEVLACLAGVRAACSRKAALIASGGNEEALSAALSNTSKLLAGRRSLARVAGALPELARTSREQAQKLAADPAMQALLEAYLFDEALSSAGHAPYPSTEDVGRAYPYLKVQKPRGRAPGQKTKK